MGTDWGHGCNLPTLHVKRPLDKVNEENQARKNKSKTQCMCTMWPHRDTGKGWWPRVLSMSGSQCSASPLPRHAARVVSV